MIKNLNPTEKKLYEFFKKLKGNSLWQIAIHNVCASGSEDKFRSLVAQLKSQAGDEPDIMKRIIGADAYDVLMVL